jgi:hypothetical protein
VYRAYDRVMSRRVAIKVLTMVEDPGLLGRFRAEAGTTGNLRHENIITVFDYGEHEGQPYLVMELLEGISLETAIRDKTPLSLLEKVEILVRVAEGLRYAHEHGVVHRDVKPSNVMLLKDGGVKILDFGIAKFKDQNQTRHTTPGLLIGTLEYMAPDQLQGSEADELTDIYSFGVVAYELFSGNQPFRAPNISRILYLVMNLEPPPVRELNAEVPEALDRIVQTALCKERTQRRQSLQELLLDLGPIAAALRQERAAELSEEAEQLAARGDLDGAQSRLCGALALDPAQRKGQALRKEIQRQREIAAGPRKSHESRICAEDQPQRQPENILAEVQGRVSEHLAAGRFTKAEQLVSGALKRFPGDGGFLSLRSQIEAGRIEADRIEAERRAGGLAGEARHAEPPRAAQPVESAQPVEKFRPDAAQPHPRFAGTMLEAVAKDYVRVHGEARLKAITDEQLISWAIEERPRAAVSRRKRNLTPQA